MCKSKRHPHYNKPFDYRRPIGSRVGGGITNILVGLTCLWFAGVALSDNSNVVIFCIMAVGLMIYNRPRQ